TGTVGEAGAGAGLSGSQAPSSSNPSNSSLLGGELPAGGKMKLGDKVINLPGNVGVGDNGGNFKSRRGLPAQNGKRPRQTAVTHGGPGTLTAKQEGPGKTQRSQKAPATNA